jgi:hypothetical protein
MLTPPPSSPRSAIGKTIQLRNVEGSINCVVSYVDSELCCQGFLKPWQPSHRPCTPSSLYAHGHGDGFTLCEMWWACRTALHVDLKRALQ